MKVFAFVSEGQEEEKNMLEKYTVHYRTRRQHRKSLNDPWV